MKNENRDICIECRKEFVWKNVGDVYAGGKDREEIICPYCGEINGTRMTSGRIEARKVTD